MPVKETVYKNLLTHTGIGAQLAAKICEELGISKATLGVNLTPAKKDALNQTLTKLKKNEPGIDESLKANVTANITRQIQINSYRRKTA